MKNKMKWVYMMVGGFLAVGLIAGAGFAFLTSEAAGRLSPSTQGATPYSGWLSDGDHPKGKYEEALAEALGITVEELQDAHQAVFQSQIEAAVAAGDMTDEQAEHILGREGFGPRGRRNSGERAGEMSALLAAELGISVSTLEAAQQEAREQLMAEALENGDISQEQYDLMQSHQALAPYLQEAMAEAFEQAVNEALIDGAISQSQADLLLESDRPGMSGGRFPGGPGMRGFKGQFPGGRHFSSDEG